MKENEKGDVRVWPAVAGGLSGLKPAAPIDTCGLKPAAPINACGLKPAAPINACGLKPAAPINAVSLSERSALADKRVFRKSLRCPCINYRSGWFFVTSQVAHNQPIFGAVVDDKVVLNELGRRVWAYWQALPVRYPELEIVESVLMPNHFHALVHIHFRETNRPHHLGFLIGRFKGGTGHLYGEMRRAGTVANVGEHLWQFDYWDELVASAREFENQVRYVRDNPKNWSRDRYGACTSYTFGNLDLLNAPRIAFIASQGFAAREFKIRKIWDVRAEARRPDKDACGTERAEARRPDKDACGTERAEARRPDKSNESTGSLSGRSALADKPSVLISTFTSAQEREVLRRALACGRRLIQVFPQGIPSEGHLSADLRAACQDGRALLLSPQPPESRLDKKTATWCNEYVLRYAEAIWAGDLATNGMLVAVLRGLGRYDGCAG